MLVASRARAASALFGESFDDFAPDGVESDAAAAGVAARAAPALTEADVEAARSSAWADGFKCGRERATAAEADRLAAAMTRIATELEEGRRALLADAEGNARQMALLLLDMLRVMLPATCERYGEAEMRSVIRAILPPLTTEPAVRIRVAPPLAEAARTEVDRLDPDIAERVEIVPTAAMRPGDVRIAWRGGGAVRDAQAAWRELAAALAASGLSLEAPALEAPALEAPARQAPARQAPARQAAAREAPTREAPTLEAHTRENALVG